MNEHDIDKLLQQRHMEEPSKDLTSRITFAAAGYTPQKSAWWHGWYIPKSVYAFSFASFLVIGVMLNFSTVRNDEVAAISDTEIFTEIFYYPDDMLF